MELAGINGGREGGRAGRGGEVVLDVECKGERLGRGGGKGRECREGLGRAVKGILQKGFQRRGVSWEVGKVRVGGREERGEGMQR